ncbi:carbohydrate sulfotransferase 11-like [Oratosquilla oratoria]|uniref:carbohydrate sulfotransferase 11-like n=1 Tax=Oratosquilla oratoria TaxID=337810 RepID=UPI003F75B44F
MLTFLKKLLRPANCYKFKTNKLLSLLLPFLGLVLIGWVKLAFQPPTNEFRTWEYPGEVEEGMKTYTLSPIEMTQMDKEIASRRDRVRDECRKSPLPGKIWESLQFNVFYFFDHNASVCLMGKTGTSTWRIHLRKLNGGPPLDRPMKEDPRRSELMGQPLDQIVHFFDSTIKILTVRHPFIRLVSAYRQKYNDGKSLGNYNPNKIKVIAGNTWHDSFQEFWLPAMLSNFLIPQKYYLSLQLDKPLNRSTRYPNWIYEKICHDLRPRITFKQFLHHVIRTFQDDHMDTHWDMYHVQCSVCYFDYDFIIKTENMSEELAYIANKLGMNIDPHIRMNQARKMVQLESDLKYFSKIPQWMRKKIYEIYADDMRLFNYDLPAKFLEEV